MHALDPSLLPIRLRHCLEDGDETWASGSAQLTNVNHAPAPGRAAVFPAIPVVIPANVGIQLPP